MENTIFDLLDNVQKPDNLNVNSRVLIVDGLNSLPKNFRSKWHIK